MPEEIQNQITEGGGDFETLQIEDSFSEEEEITEEEEIFKEPFFGYNFFNKSSETNAPVLDIPLQSDYIISWENNSIEINRIIKALYPRANTTFKKKNLKIIKIKILTIDEIINNHYKFLSD